MRDHSTPLRETSLFDAYAGLRRIGYTVLGAIRALRALGISLAEAKAVSDRYETETGGTPWGGAR